MKQMSLDKFQRRRNASFKIKIFIFLNSYNLESNPKQIRALIGLNPCFYLTNRFLVAVRLFSNRSQMTSKCDKNKKMAHEAIAECVTDVLTTF